MLSHINLPTGRHGWPRPPSINISSRYDEGIVANTFLSYYIYIYIMAKHCPGNIRIITLYLSWTCMNNDNMTIRNVIITAVFPFLCSGLHTVVQSKDVQVLYASFKCLVYRRKVKIPHVHLVVPHQITSQTELRSEALPNPRSMDRKRVSLWASLDVGINALQTWPWTQQCVTTDLSWPPMDQDNIIIKTVTVTDLSWSYMDYDSIMINILILKPSWSM